MKVIIPLAGKGTRLRPHTHTVPKPMLKVAGKPVMDYVMDDVKKLGTVTEVIYITGHLKEAVEQHARTVHAALPATFIEQKVQDGTAGAIALAKAYVQEPVLIIFVDTIFDADLSIVNTTEADGIIWTKTVEDYQRFGVVVTDERGMMTRIVEKPKEPISKRANIGLYYVRNWRLLFEGIDHVLASPPNKGEFYLTDAFQYMIDHGAKLQVVDVEGWYDAGQVETLLDTNRVMLEKGRARKPAPTPGVTFIDPVYVEDGVSLRDATIGPNVSIGSGTTIEGAVIRHSVIGHKAQVRHSSLEASLVGDHAIVEHVRGTVSVGDHAEVHGKP